MEGTINGLIMMIMFAAASAIIHFACKIIPGRDRPAHFVVMGVVVVGMIWIFVAMSNGASKPSGNYEWEDDYSWARAR